MQTWRFFFARMSVESVVSTFSPLGSENEKKVPNFIYKTWATCKQFLPKRIQPEDKCVLYFYDCLLTAISVCECVEGTRLAFVFYETKNKLLQMGTTWRWIFTRRATLSSDFPITNFILLPVLCVRMTFTDDFRSDRVALKSTALSLNGLSKHHKSEGKRSMKNICRQHQIVSLQLLSDFLRFASFIPRSFRPSSPMPFAKRVCVFFRERKENSKKAFKIDNKFMPLKPLKMT